MKKLADKGIIEHLSPYDRRHPLLPEYRLTEKGQFLREVAQCIQWVEQDLNRGILYEKSWNWPVILALHNQYTRFQAIRKILPEATPRIISIRLDELIQNKLAEKVIVDESRLSYRYHLYSSVEMPVNKLETHLNSLL